MNNANNLNEIPIQETTSTYFNNILKKEVKPKSREELNPEILTAFDNAVDDAFTDASETVKSRIKYLVPYIIQNIDWDEYGVPLEAWQLKYYYQRDRFLKKTRLKYEEFLSHPYLMESIRKLGLEPDPVFEFILFLWYYYSLRSDLKFSSIEQLQKLQEALKGSDTDAQMDVAVNGKHFKFKNSGFIKMLFADIDSKKLSYGNFKDDFNEGASREKIRAIDYYLVKTLLDYLPIVKDKGRGLYSQAERDFSLSVLNYVGRLVGEELEFLCGFDNNATFDKLMRDFKNQKIPFAMELFL